MLQSLEATLPREIKLVKVPPIKIQGIKTKLVPFILENIKWSGNGKWVEPFLGSGVVLFNVNPKKALIADSNPHIISFYQNLQNNRFTPDDVRHFLEKEGALLRTKGDGYYYEVRRRFNSNQNPLDLLFLSRACFNGLMRLNKKGEFNVPFNHKIERFSKAYITKIVNQIKWVSKEMAGKDWQFICEDWRETFKNVQSEDFVYLDPPYFGRHTGYVGNWTEEEMLYFLKNIKLLPCNYALSLWKKSVYRVNTTIDEHFSDHIIRLFSHDYFVGPTQNLRHEIEEALIIRPTRSSDIN